MSGESGVSWLIEAGESKLLVNVGFNAKGEHPSPFLRNLNALGQSIEDIKSIFISHLHADHVGASPRRRAVLYAQATGISISSGSRSTLRRQWSMPAPKSGMSRIRRS